MSKIIYTTNLFTVEEKTAQLSERVVKLITDNATLFFTLNEIKGISRVKENRGTDLTETLILTLPSTTYEIHHSHPDGLNPRVQKGMTDLVTLRYGKF